MKPLDNKDKIKTKNLQLNSGKPFPDPSCEVCSGTGRVFPASKQGFWDEGEFCWACLDAVHVSLVDL